MPDAAIFLLQEGHSLIELKQQPYDSEDLLQELLERYPRLLAGDQVNPSSPRRWLLVSREAGLPDQEGGSDRWSVDHLFLDQDAIPTIVEVKRSSDTRIRREVVGQMLDYAANAVVYWPVERLIQLFETTSTVLGFNADEVLSEFLEGGNSVEFWQSVKTNLQAGKVRMIFVADEIPPQLQRIVEFLNSQMDPAEVLAVEIRQFVGEQSRTLVPRVIGQTIEAQNKKSIAGEGSSWDRDSLLAAIETRSGNAARVLANQIIDWAESKKLQMYWGKGKVFGSFVPYFKYNGQTFIPFTMYSYGKIEIPFGILRTRPPFNQDFKRVELLNMLNEVSGVNLPADSISKRPTVLIAEIAKQDSLFRLLACFEWAMKEYREQS